MKDGNPASSSKRWWLWLALLGVGAWLAVFGDKSPASGAALSVPTKAPALSAERTSATELEPADASAVPPDSPLALQPREQLFASHAAEAASGRTAQRDLFAAHSWNPPQPPAPAPAAPAAPVAPPLPFAFLGKKLEGATWEVYLARGEQSFVAREGQVLEGDWRVERIAPPSLAFIYMPLGQQLTLSIGDLR